MNPELIQQDKDKILYSIANLLMGTTADFKLFMGGVFWATAHLEDIELLGTKDCLDRFGKHNWRMGLYFAKKQYEEWRAEIIKREVDKPEKIGVQDHAITMIDKLIDDVAEALAKEREEIDGRAI